MKSRTFGQKLGRLLGSNHQPKTENTTSTSTKLLSLAALVFVPSPDSFDAVKDAFKS